ncbi:MAG TPA: rhodanese-like domain-containing protein [Rhodothermales bacterium]|nr:rhodanese-like domain-containing protein [Bacteroidota bacterium]HRK73525.1 rhodanese-like domain-containing protein [Rhodothermales bacterium]HRR09784.1 rhodanese-like domain-containing protein [Rhodothermales bacterium]
MRIFILLFLLLVTACNKPSQTTETTSGSTTTGILEADVTTFAEAAKQPGVQIVDVRTAQEFRMGHLPQSRNIDIMAPGFENRVQLLDKEKPVLVYCAVGSRSARAAEMMSGLGFKTVTNLSGGIQAWGSAGMPIE